MDEAEVERDQATSRSSPRRWFLRWASMASVTSSGHRDAFTTFIKKLEEDIELTQFNDGILIAFFTYLGSTATTAVRTVTSQQTGLAAAVFMTQQLDGRPKQVTQVELYKKVYAQQAPKLITIDKT